MRIEVASATEAEAAAKKSRRSRLLDSCMILNTQFQKKKIENCDLIKAGVKALRTYLELYDWDEYKAVKAYAGKGKKAHEYSLRILRIKTKTQNLLKDLNHENLIIIEN